jgi:hypothetical protein
MKTSHILILMGIALLFLFIVGEGWGEEYYFVQWGEMTPTACPNTSNGELVLSMPAVACMRAPTVKLFLSKDDAIKAIIGNNPSHAYKMLCTFGFGDPSCYFEELDVVETKDFRSKK